MIVVADVVLLYLHTSIFLCIPNLVIILSLNCQEPARYIKEVSSSKVLDAFAVFPNESVLFTRLNLSIIISCFSFALKLYFDWIPTVSFLSFLLCPKTTLFAVTLP